MTTKTVLKKYRRKPVTVEAIQWTVRYTPSDDAKPIVDLINSLGGKAYFLYDFVESEGRHSPRIMIETLEGTMAAKPNDYICRGLAGEFWAVRPDIFEKTNEEVTDVGSGTPMITTSESDTKLTTLQEHD